MMITFDFSSDPVRKQELKNFVDPNGPHYPDYLALLKRLGVQHQRWHFYTPKSSAPPGYPPKLVIRFDPDDKHVLCRFLDEALGTSASTITQDALRTLPVGTVSGPDFSQVWPDLATYDSEQLFSV